MQRPGAEPGFHFCTCRNPPPEYNQGMYLNYDNVFENGDMIGVVRPYPRHVGVYASGRGVIHNAKGGFVQLTDMATFSGGRPVRAIRRVAGTWWDKEAAVNRAMSLLGQPYDLINFNCEHAAYYALEGKPRSPQLGLAVATLVMVGLLFAFTN